MRASLVAALPVVLFTVACALPGSRVYYDDGGWETGDREPWETGDWWETGESDTDDGDGALVFSLEDPSCDGDVWVHELRTQGWAGSAELLIRDTISNPSRGERHTLASIEQFEEGGARYEDLGVTLEIDEDSEYSDGVTALSCAREDMLTWYYLIYDDNGVLQDCVVYGAEPEFTGSVEEGDTEAVPEGCFVFD